MYFQGGGSIRFAAGFIAGLLLRETATLKTRRPPRSVLVPANKNDDGQMILVRQLQPGDWDKGFLDLLGQLTTVGNVTKETFLARLTEIKGGPEFVFVVEEHGVLLASGTVVLERKFARDAGMCAHIEDVVVDVSCRGRGMGLVVITALMKVAERMGCYKVILDCAEANQGFYVKCGLARKECQMVKYFKD